MAGEGQYPAPSPAPARRGGSWNKLEQCWEFSGDDPTPRLAAGLRSARCGSPRWAGEGFRTTSGHRARLRERALTGGIEPFADYELLELLLFYSIERIDTKPIARRLLDRFGTLGDVFAAEPEEFLEFEIDRRTVVHFKALREKPAGDWPNARSRTCR